MGRGNLFDWLMLAVAVYILFCGITGKGKGFYQMDGVKEGCEKKLRKFMQRDYIFIGVTMLINAASMLTRGFLYEQVQVADTAKYEWVAKTDLGAWAFLTPKLLNNISYAGLILCLAGIFGMVIMIRKNTDKEAAEKARRERAEAAGRTSGGTAGSGGHILPTAAFDFDEPEAPAEGYMPAEGDMPAENTGDDKAE